MKIERALAKAYPDVRCALRHESAFQLLVSTILSAQCTDVRVNMVTPALFKRWSTAKAMARARRGDVEQVIRSTGFFRSKAKHIIASAKLIEEKFAGEVPGTMEGLLELPGVARKTANVVLGTWFGKAEGVVVDTHVMRLSRRLGLTKEHDPKKIERDLMELLPRSAWIDFSHRLIQHGRRVCRARTPGCGECPLRRECPSAEKFEGKVSPRPAGVAAGSRR